MRLLLEHTIVVITQLSCDISQFEHQVKIVTKQNPENSTLINPSVMINLLGDLWEH